VPVDVIILGGGPAGISAPFGAPSSASARPSSSRTNWAASASTRVHSDEGPAALRYIANPAAGIQGIRRRSEQRENDYGVAMKRSRRVSDQNSKGVEFLMKKHKITVIKGTGVVQPGKRVKVAATCMTQKQAVVIATGSRVKGIPQIGLEINKTT